MKEIIHIHSMKLFVRMDGRKDGWMYGCMYVWMDACMVYQTSEYVKYILHGELES